MIGSQAARARLEHWIKLYDGGIIGMICSDVLTVIDELERHMYAEISAQHERERGQGGDSGPGPDDTAESTESTESEPTDATESEPTDATESEPTDATDDGL